MPFFKCVCILLIIHGRREKFTRESEGVQLFCTIQIPLVCNAWFIIKLTLCSVKQLTLTDIWSGGTVPHTFLSSALGGVYLSTCHPLHFTLYKRVPDTYREAGWVSEQVLDVVVKGKVSARNLFPLTCCHHTDGTIQIV